jgi:hypothetical protein
VATCGGGHAKFPDSVEKSAIATEYYRQGTRLQNEKDS